MGMDRWHPSEVALQLEHVADCACRDAVAGTLANGGLIRQTKVIDRDCIAAYLVPTGQPDPWADVPNMRPAADLRKHQAVVAPQLHPVRICPFCPVPTEPELASHPGGQLSHEARPGPDTDALALAAREERGCEMARGHLCACPAAPYEYAGCWVRRQARPLYG